MFYAKYHNFIPLKLMNPVVSSFINFLIKSLLPLGFDFLIGKSFTINRNLTTIDIAKFLQNMLHDKILFMGVATKIMSVSSLNKTLNKCLSDPLTCNLSQNGNPMEGNVALVMMLPVSIIDLS